MEANTICEPCQRGIHRMCEDPETCQCEINLAKRAERAVEVIFEHENQWTHDSIVRIEEEYYKRHGNGGSQGAWDDRQFHPHCEVIDRTEARRLALEWGYEPEEVAEKLP